MRILPVLFCFLLGVVGLAGSLAAATPPDEDAIVAVFPPWWASARSFAAASGAGAVVNAGTFPFVLLVQSPLPGLGARLRAAGAILLLDPLGPAGCGPSPMGDKNV